MRRFVVVLACMSLCACGEEGALDAPGVFQDPLTSGPCTLENITVKKYGQVVFTGDMDLLSEVQRIVRGEHLPFKHDGTVFQNREHRLPIHTRGYYHEYVHPTPGINGPGPQRIVMGEGREVEYTEDHYVTFHLLPDSCLVSASGF